VNPFTPGGPEIPPAPFEVPVPDIPAADFVQIGKQAAEGMAKGGLLDQWADKLLKLLSDAVGIIVAGLLGLVDMIVIKILQYVFKGFALNESGMDELAATVISGMTGVPASASNFSDARNRQGRAPIAGGLVDILTAALSEGAAADPDGGMQPGKQGAEKFLGLVAHMAIEGWMFGFVAELESLNFLSEIGDLKDTLEQSMGLGRLSRRALAAPMKVLVEDPYTALLNQSFRPTVPSVEILVRQYLRGFIDRTVLDKLGGKLGYSNAGIEALINFNRAHLSPGDIETLRLHGNISDGVATDMLKAQGYDDATANSLQVALGQGRHDAWARTLVSEALAALVTRHIDIDQFQSYLEASGLPDDERRIIAVVANLKVLTSRKRFTLAEGETLVKKGLWSLDQFSSLATELGYTSQDETDLELMLLVDIKDAADAATKKAAATKAKADAAAARTAALKAKAAAAAAAAEAKGLSLARFETLVTDGLRSVADYKVFLAGKGIAADNITALVTALQDKLDKAAAAALARPGLAAGAKAKNLDLAQLEAGVKSGVIALPEFETRLEGIGFTPEDVQLLSAVLSDQLGTAKVKADAKAAAAAKAKSKGVDLAQEQRGVRLGLLTVDQYSAKLDSLGFAPADRDLLVGEINAQLAADAAAKATKAGVAGGLKQKGLSLAQLEQSVRAGLSTVDQYRAALATAGYDAGAQDQLVSLLQLRIEQDQQTLAAHGHAAALVGQVGLSLTDLERAVKLGVVDVTVYTDALSKAGVSADDAQILTLSLAAQVKATKGAQVAFKAAEQTLKLGGLSLTKLEQDVLAGRTTPEQFGAILAGASVPAADAAAVVKLVTDELANLKHVDALTGAVAASAAAKGLSLAQEEAAVRAGVKSLDDFRAFVTRLNYSAGDVETLVGTLAAKLKAPAPAPPAVP
jgi:hypothetical protein